MEVIDKAAPVKSKRIKRNSQEWFNSEISEKLIIRDKLFKKYKKTRLHVDQEIYKRVRYSVRNLIAKKKKEFFETKLKECIGKPKDLWKAIKSLGLPNKSGGCIVGALAENQIVKHDTKSILKTFRSFYSNLAGNLSAKLPKSANRYTIKFGSDYYETLSLSEKFKLDSITEGYLFNVLKHVEVTKAAGVDQISGKFLKDGGPIVAKPICELCNLSMALGSFSDACKIAKVKPLFKKGSKTDPSNYRPVSLLPLLSKVFERVVLGQTEEFLSLNKILYDYQFSFRKNHLSFLNDKILKGFDDGLETGMILTDVQKAFDTINHDIRLKKLSIIGFSDHTIKWFQSYLSNRTFMVNLENSFSEISSISCSVPQGSILGPFLFLLYVNDMPMAVKCDLFLYADDTCLVFQRKNVKDIEKQLNEDFASIWDWFVDNKLSIHFGEDKTKSILFASKRKIKKLQKLEIIYNNIRIKQHSRVTYLGCILEETMSRKSMANKVINKFNARLKFLHQKNKYLTPNLRLLLCNALIQPHFDYAWYPNYSKKLKNIIQTLQNKCIRFCLQLDEMSHISQNFFETINWLPIKERVRKFNCLQILW